MYIFAYFDVVSIQIIFALLYGFKYFHLIPKIIWFRAIISIKQ